MRQTQKTHKTGVRFEGRMAKDEEDALNAIMMQNLRSRMQKREAREAAKKAEEIAKITLPKLKWME